MDIDFLDPPGISRAHDLAAGFALVNGHKILFTMPLSAAERLYCDWEDIVADRIAETFRQYDSSCLWPGRVDLMAADFESV